MAEVEQKIGFDEALEALRKFHDEIFMILPETANTYVAQYNNLVGALLAARSSSCPRITFKPYEIPQPTLDQVPDGEYHLCKNSMDENAPKSWLCRRGLYVYQQLSSGGDGRSLVDGPRHWQVLDTDPITPKTLADVPPDVWCIDRHGNIVVRCAGGGKALSIGHAGRSAFTDPHNSITHVLGTPQFEQGATP